ncbi:hypothetical protein OUHCRE2_15960 [Enterobacter asburiae]|nr:hypothetical protein TUM17556_12010 [Enterobacter asburiae]
MIAHITDETLVVHPGCQHGKTALVEGLALRIAEGNVPESLKPVILRTLDLGLLQAGAGVKGEFEQRLKNVIDAVQQSPIPILLFIDEAHTIIGAGTVDMPMEENAQYVAVAGMFMSPDQENNTWRVVMSRDDLDPDKARVIEAGNNQLTMQALKDE